MTGNNCPLVSVIVPYYNGKAYIREAIESILAQTYPNIEIVVVDDASPDPAHTDYVKQLAAELKFKLICHAENRGIGHTMADAAEASRGQYIAELSQDDFYKPAKIEQQMQELAEKNLDAVYAAGDILRQSTGRMEMRQTAETAEIIRSGRAADYLKLQNLVCVSIQGLLARRDVFENDIIPIWRDYLLDDWPVNACLFAKYRVGFLEGPLWTGRGHDSNTSRNIWKWFGPQIEVVARLAPDALKCEAVGNRIGSMARRLAKQNAAPRDIVRLSMAALVLADAPEQQKKCSRVLKKMPHREKNAVSKAVCNFLKTPARQSAGASACCPNGTTWDTLGKEVAQITAVHAENERVHAISEPFAQLSARLLADGQGDRADAAVRLALAAAVMAGSLDRQKEILGRLQPPMRNSAAPLIRKKTRMLEAGCGFFLQAMPGRFWRRSG